jgi:hypothetical protein
MKRYLVYALGALVLCVCWQVSLAQTVTQTDATCIVWAGGGCLGPNGQGCDTTTFTVPQGETAYFNVYLQGCSKTTACQCHAAGYILDERNNVIDCRHSGCNDCVDHGAVSENLVAGHTYKLLACKVSCTDNCTTCVSVCVAYSVVSYFP